MTRAGRSVNGIQHGFSVGLAVFLAAVAYGFGQERPDPKAIFADLAPKKWEEYTRFSKRLQGKNTSTTINTLRFEDKEKKDDVKETVWRYELSQNATSASLAVAKSPSGGEGKAEWAFGANTKYNFKITRKEGSEDWVLATLNLNPKEKLPGLFHPTVQEEVASNGSPHFSVFETPLSQAFANPGFKLGKVSPVDRDGRELTQVELEFPEKLGKHTLVVRGSVLLDPERYWYIVESNLSRVLPGGVKQSGFASNKVVDNSRKFPVIKEHNYRVESRSASGDFLGSREGRMEFDLREVANVPEHAISLSAFGLPEPQGIKWNRGTPAYIWILLAAVGALVVSLLFHRYARRPGTANGS